MAKTKTPQTVSNVTDFEDLKKYIAITVENIVATINGDLQFGDNLKTQIVSVNFNVANTEIATPHGLGITPSGYLVVGRDGSYTVYNGNNANTSSTLYLRASGTGIAQVMVF